MAQFRTQHGRCSSKEQGDDCRHVQKSCSQLDCLDTPPKFHCHLLGTKAVAGACVVLGRHFQLNGVVALNEDSRCCEVMSPRVHILAGVPYIDACMRELRQTGWLAYKGRKTAGQPRDQPPPYRYKIRSTKL
eukprot:4721236-Amphidinium_carterae.1